MKTKDLITKLVLAGSFAASPALLAQSRFDELAKLPMDHNRPTAETAQTLKDELLFQRATQAYPGHAAAQHDGHV